MNMQDVFPKYMSLYTLEILGHVLCIIFKFCLGSYQSWYPVVLSSRYTLVKNILTGEVSDGNKIPTVFHECLLGSGIIWMLKAAQQMTCLVLNWLSTNNTLNQPFM
jgi:hypothetical protein